MDKLEQCGWMTGSDEWSRYYLEFFEGPTSPLWWLHNGHPINLCWEYWQSTLYEMVKQTRNLKLGKEKHLQWGLGRDQHNSCLKVFARLSQWRKIDFWIFQSRNGIIVGSHWEALIHLTSIFWVLLCARHCLGTWAGICEHHRPRLILLWRLQYNDLMCLMIKTVRK